MSKFATRFCFSSKISLYRVKEAAILPRSRLHIKTGSGVSAPDLDEVPGFHAQVSGQLLA